MTSFPQWVQLVSDTVDSPEEKASFLRDCVEMILHAYGPPAYDVDPVEPEGNSRDRMLGYLKQALPHLDVQERVDLERLVNAVVAHVQEPASP